MPGGERARALLVAAALVLAGCGTGSPGGTSTTSADYQHAYQVGLQAYTYGLPLLVTDATYQTMTSVDVSQGPYGPVNQFNNVRSPNSSSSTAVVAPGATSLSSIAWVDLQDEPQVLHVPEVTDHAFVLALLDPYTENLVNLGSASGTAPGDYVLLDPQQKGTVLPAGTHAIAVDYSRIWIIGSTQLKGASDVATVNKIQDGYTLTPLSRYGTDYVPATPTNPATTVMQHGVPTGLAFFDQLGAELAAFPPPAADTAALDSFASVGIGPGRTPSADRSLSADTVQGLLDAVSAGPTQVQQTDTQALVAQDAPTHAGYLLGGFGSYGTDYVERAVISQIGLGAFLPQQAVYAMTWSDSTKATLDGSKPYVLHLTTPPPTREGWSLTVYTLQGALVSGPGGRVSALTNISDLTPNADGSIDLYLQQTAPSGSAAQNWIPTPAGQGFEIAWRLFAPDTDALQSILDGSGWQPPRVTAAGSAA